MDVFEYEQIQNFLRNGTIPAELKSYKRRNFIRRCSVYRLGEDSLLFKVRNITQFIFTHGNFFN